MRVKIGETWYDSKDEQVMIEVSDIEKGLIANMGEQQSRLCCFPEGTPEEAVVAFMEIPLPSPSKAWN